jgi:hypothetical protein
LTVACWAKSTTMQFFIILGYFGHFVQKRPTAVSLRQSEEQNSR